MGVQLDNYRIRKPLRNSARRLIIDAAQLINYIDDGRKAPAVKNAKAMIKSMEKLLPQLKKAL